MNWTHQKRAYKARLLQWDGTNLSAVSVELRELGYDSFELERGTIMARGKGMSLLCVHQGNWLRFGQNGSFKVMRPDEQETYIPILNEDDLRVENDRLRAVISPPWSVDEIMTQVQVVASAWGLVGSRFDTGNAMDNFNTEEEILRSMLATGTEK